MGPMFTATSADIMCMAIVTLTAMLTRTASHISDRIRFFLFSFRAQFIRHVEGFI